MDSFHVKQDRPELCEDPFVLAPLGEHPPLPAVLTNVFFEAPTRKQLARKLWGIAWRAALVFAALFGCVWAALFIGGME